MCQAKPGCRCSTDALADQQSTQDAYARQHPTGPPVSVLGAAEASGVDRRGEFNPTNAPNPVLAARWENRELGEVLDEWASSNDPHDRVLAAKDEHTSDSTLRRLATDRDTRVVQAVARNENAS